MLKLKAILAKLLNIAGKFISATGPLAIIRNGLTIASLGFALFKLIKKLIAKIKSHKKSKTPETVTEYALSDKETRESAPEVKERYDDSIQKTVNKLIGKPKKHVKDAKRGKKLREMLDELDDINPTRKVKNYTPRRNMGVSELLDSDPVLRAWAFGDRKVCHS